MIQWKKVKSRIQTGMKLILGFSCDWWPPVLTLTPQKPIKHAHHTVASLFLCIPLFLFFFPPKWSHWHWCKIEEGWGGGWRGKRQGCRVSWAQCEQLRGVISQAGSPLSGSWLGRTGGAGEARASKGHQQVGGRFGGGRSRAGLKRPICKACCGHNPLSGVGGGRLVAGEQEWKEKRGEVGEWVSGSGGSDSDEFRLW